MRILPYALIALASQLPLHAQATAGHEPAAALEASSLLPADLLRGTSHRVREHVVTDGYLAHFQIDSDFGVFEAVGVPQVATRVAEIEAIRKLVETSKSDLFAEGLKRSITKPIDAVKNIAEDPVTSIKRAPKTVGHFFGKVGGSIERAASKTKEKLSSDESPSAAEVGGGISETAKNVAGFDMARLETAKQLGVDPYSDNVRLQEEMDKVTWAFFAGGLPLRIGAAVASAGVAVAATNMVGVPEDTYALTKSELALRDSRSLAGMGVSEADISAFQIQASLSTTRRHRIVKALEAMPKAAGRGYMIRLANSVESSGQADFLVSALEIIASRPQAADYRELVVFGRLPGAINGDGTLDVPAPVDHVTWTEQVAGFASRDDLGSAKKRILHTGKFSQATSAGFTAAGWATEAIPYPGLP